MDGKNRTVREFNHAHLDTNRSHISQPLPPYNVRSDTNPSFADRRGRRFRQSGFFFIFFDRTMRDDDCAVFSGANTYFSKIKTGVRESTTRHSSLPVVGDGRFGNRTTKTTVTWRRRGGFKADLARVRYRAHKYANGWPYKTPFFLRHFVQIRFSIESRRTTKLDGVSDGTFHCNRIIISAARRAFPPGAWTVSRAHVTQFPL